MSDSGAFTEGMRAYRQGAHAHAAQVLAVPAGRDDLMGRLARYYCAMAHRALGVADLQAGRYNDAIRRLRQAANLVGHKTDLVEYLLSAYARTGQVEGCTVQADLLAEARPQDVSARVRLALAQWRSGRRATGMMTLTAAVRQLGDQAEPHLLLGLFHAERGEHEQARRHLAKAVECDCTSVRALRYLGLAYSVLGDFVRAAGAFARALALAPDDVLLAWHLSQAAAAARQTGQTVTLALPEKTRATRASGLQQLAEYVADEPDFVEAYLALPESEADADLFAVLVTVLRTALAMHPDYADLHYFAGVALARLGDLESAEEHARQAVRINPRYARALVHLARLHQQRGDPGQAIERLRQAVGAGADWADVHVRLADLLRQQGNSSDSARHYRQALRLNPGYAPASTGLTALAA